MSRDNARRSSWKGRSVMMVAALAPLLMAARCDSGDSGSDVVDIVRLVVDLVLSIISIAS